MLHVFDRPAPSPTRARHAGPIDPDPVAAGVDAVIDAWVGSGRVVGLAALTAADGAVIYRRVAGHAGSPWSC